MGMGETNLPEINVAKYLLKENNSFSYSEIILKLLSNPSIFQKMDL